MKDSQVDSYNRPPNTGPSHEAKPMLNMFSSTAQGRYQPRRLLPAIRPREEVNQAVKRKPFKIGKVSVVPVGKDGWCIRYQDPASKRDVRRRLDGLSTKQIHETATHISHELLTKGGYIPGKGPSAPTIAEGLAEAIGLANTLEATRKERARRAMKFVEWLAEHHPGVKTWDQLRPGMVQAYAVQLERAGKAFDTVRLDVAPIKLTWRYMADNYPDLVRPMPRIKLTPAPPREIECLEPAEVAVLLEWLRDNAPNLWPMACLQALAGLRMLEAARLREQDVDLAAKTVTVTDTGFHRPKTRSSYRTIPVCDEVVASLRVAMTAQKIKPATGELFTNSRGDLWQRTALGHRWTNTLRRFVRHTDNPRFAQIPARKLRAAFVTMAGLLGVPDRLLKVYVGHSPGDILGAHYRRVDVAELRTVSDRMNDWRKWLDEQRSGIILATGEQDLSSAIESNGLCISKTPAF